MSGTLPNFSNTQILVIGDIMLDRYWAGNASRISPEAPVPVVDIKDVDNRLGGAANVALNLATLGCKVTLTGFVGNDSPGKIVGKLIEEKGISNEIVTSSEAQTITKLRVLSSHQQLIRLDFEEETTHQDADLLSTRVEHIIDNMDAVIISDYAKGAVSQPENIIKLCNERDIDVYVDPKGTDFSRYKRAKVITPNRGELEAVIGKHKSIETTLDKATELSKEQSIESILVTLGDQGMALVDKNGEHIHIPTEAQDVYDVTGAGDTVIATLCAAITSGCSIRRAMHIANTAAGIVVGKLGTATTSIDELSSALSNQINPSKKNANSVEELLSQVTQYRTQGEKIVFTNGCFDLLHAGHVRYLRQAAKLGDKLVIGLNSDESVKKLKGPLRPITPLEERIELLSSLECVDWVIPFEDETPLNLIEALSPEVLVKGGDYQRDEIVGFQHVTQHGGQVLTLPLVGGCSTTSIIEKIKGQLEKTH